MSEGEFSAYMRERGDGLDTLAWIREQPFYNGEIFCNGRQLHLVCPLVLSGFGG